jgi:hypothetical protein
MLTKDFVGRLAVYVDEPPAFPDGNQIVSGFAVWAVGYLQNHLRAGDEQLFTAPGVFYMSNDRFAVNINVCNEAIGAREEYSGYGIRISHSPITLT